MLVKLDYHQLFYLMIIRSIDDFISECFFEIFDSIIFLTMAESQACVISHIATKGV